MRQENTAWPMLQYALFLEEEKRIAPGRDVIFKRCKESSFEMIDSRALGHDILDFCERELVTLGKGVGVSTSPFLQ